MKKLDKLGKEEKINYHISSVRFSEFDGTKRAKAVTLMNEFQAGKKLRLLGLFTWHRVQHNIPTATGF